ncbi:MAG: HEPN domain-containing protein [Polyangiaceae bacterium]|nr:HEPN domain-containing protein [Polyangiaceae bacterium]
MTQENQKLHIAAEVARAKSARRAAEELLKLGLFSDAVSRAYYAALHYAIALLLTEGIEPKTHSGVGSMLGLHFVMQNRLSPDVAKALSRLEQFRGEADYNRFFVFTAESASEELEVAQKCCSSIELLLHEGGWL